MHLRRLAVLALVTLACGGGKLDEPGLDYGSEDAPFSAKDDSATSPASMGRLLLDAVLKTTFTSTSRWRAFKFTATAGEKLDLYVDGLRGLDTVAYIYNVSATTGRPYSRAIAKNDDTENPGWTVGSNTAVNEQSSSILGFVPRYSREYAVVVTTYRQAGRGTASVVLRRARAGAPAFATGGPGRAIDLKGVRAEVLTVQPELTALAASAPGISCCLTTFPAAYRFAPADVRAAFAADPARPAFLGAAFADAFGVDHADEFFDSLADGSEVAPLPRARIADRLEEMLRDHMGDAYSAADWAKWRASLDRLTAAMVADGVTHVFTVLDGQGSGDWCDRAVAVVNADSGDVRFIAIRHTDG